MEDDRQPAEADAWTPPNWYLAGRVADAGPADPLPPPPEPTPTAPAAGFNPPSWYSRPDKQGAPPARPAQHQPVAAGVSGLQPFRMWLPRSVPPVDSEDTVAVMQGLADIIEAEGPMYASRAYQLYAKAAGLSRVGREAHRHFDALNVRGVRTNKWLRLKDRISDPAGATLYAPGSPPVVPRERGTRDLTDIPRSEIRMLMDRLALEGNPVELKRAVLRELGFIRMTERTADYLDQCLRYTWTT